MSTSNWLNPNQISESQINQGRNLYIKSITNNPLELMNDRFSCFKNCSNSDFKVNNICANDCMRKIYNLRSASTLDVTRNDSSYRDFY
mmetsp:Transcript_7882/g.8127  ORF Transcript_7882/g.8127 Transcript_7882/m.8127 type:complete len:88 (+) Transcript_7882:1710-1973(+)